MYCGNRDEVLVSKSGDREEDVYPEGFEGAERGGGYICEGRGEDPGEGHMSGEDEVV